MNRLSEYLTIALIAILGVACSPEITKKEKLEYAQQEPDTVETAIGQLVLPYPYSSESK
jgi:hypothetical protein